MATYLDTMHIYEHYSNFFVSTSLTLLANTKNKHKLDL